MLYISENGKNGSTPIVFIHGGGLSSKSWQPIIQLLPEFHCLAVDLPEHGNSRDVLFSLESAANGVIEVIRQRFFDCKVNLVGHSIGGAVILTLLRLVPELFDRVLITGCSGPLPRWLVDLSMPLLGITRWMKMDDMVRATMKQHGIADCYRGLVFEDLKRTTDKAMLRRVYDSLVTFTVPQTINQPILFCVGDQEPSGMGMDALHIAQKYIRLYPSAQGFLMPGAKHAWPLQFPEIFAEMVRAWITQQPLPLMLKPIKLK